MGGILLVHDVLTSEAGPQNMLVARNWVVKDTPTTHVHPQLPGGVATRRAGFQLHPSKSASASVAYNHTIRFEENLMEGSASDAKWAIYTKRAGVYRRNYLAFRNTPLVLREGNYFTGAPAAGYRGLIEGNYIKGDIRLNQPYHRLLGNQFDGGTVTLEYGSDHAGGQDAAADFTTFIGNRWSNSAKLEVGPSGSKKLTEAGHGGKVNGVKNYTGGFAQPSNSNLILGPNAVDGGAGYQQLGGLPGGISEVPTPVTRTELVQLGVGCDGHQPK